MSDIVERLRGTRVEVSVSPEEAADEIEALRTDNATLRAALKAHGEEAAKMVENRNEIESMRRIIYDFVGRDFSHLDPRPAIEAHLAAVLDVELEHKDAAIAELVATGRAVVDRWDSPLWKDVRTTGEYIAALRAAITKHDTSSTTTTKEEN